MTETNNFHIREYKSNCKNLAKVFNPLSRLDEMHRWPGYEKLMNSRPIYRRSTIWSIPIINFENMKEEVEA